MSYEVDILAVGDSKSGDAIALRFGDFINNPGDQKVVVIDGGFRADGEKLVKRIREDYNTEVVDLVISTHPDGDHINGLSVVLEELEVKELWMHTPWNVSEDVKKLIEDTELSESKLRNKIKKSLEAAYNLEKLANEKEIPIVEPFEGLSAFDNTIHILGPSMDYYFELAADFDMTTTKQSISSFFQKVKGLIIERWDDEKLVDPDDNAVSARNNSSVITIVQLDKHFLFLADSGVPAIHNALKYTESKDYDISANIRYLQIPHHGSKRNVGPTILDKIIGPKLPQGQTKSMTTFVSAIGDEKHPSKRVRNALLRRGVKVAETCGKDQCYRSLDVPLRENWGPIIYAEFCGSYEE